jgi:hypothetical protein
MVAAPAVPVAVPVTPVPAIPVIVAAIVDAAGGPVIIVIDVGAGAIIASAIVSAIISVFRNAARESETCQPYHD